MLKATVNEAAESFNVSAKTVREWIREGLPVHRAGDKGNGNGALVDMARAPHWVAVKRKLAPVEWAEYFDEHGPANPLREMVELCLDDQPAMVLSALIGWYRDTAAKWQAIGLTDEQARRVVFDVWSLTALLLNQYKENLDERLTSSFKLGDVDDVASLLLQGDIRSEWRSLEIQLPARLQEFIPPETREKLRKAPKGRGRK